MAWLTIDEVANELRVSRKTVATWLREGRLPGATNLGSSGAYPTASLRRAGSPLPTRQSESLRQELDTLEDTVRSALHMVEDLRTRMLRGGAE
jgi:excisionase family DNA binding protein